MAAQVPEQRVPAGAGLHRLLWGQGVSALGDGLWFTIWALYFIRVLRMTPATVAVAMALAGALGLAAAVPLGALADHRDPLAVLVALTMVRAAAMGGYLLVHTAPAFLAVTAVFGALANGSTAIRTALVAGLVRDNQERVRALAQQRVAQHVGYAIGAGLGAGVLAVDRPAAYRVAIAGNAMSFVVLAALTATVTSRRQSAPPVRHSVRVVLRDRPYCSVVAVTAVLSLCWAMISTGLPLWISESTQLPLSLSGVVVVISSVGIAALQVPTTRIARTPRQASRTATWAGGALAGSCLLLASTASRGGALAAGIVIGAALLHLTGELGYVAASWTLSVTFMREDARGAYQGVAAAATATVQMLAPGLFTLTLTTFGGRGWLLVAALFLLAGGVVPSASRWASRTRATPLAGATPLADQCP